MHKQGWLSPRDATEPVHRRTFPTSEPLEFPPHPRGKGLVEMTKDLDAPGPVEPTVVVHPATDHRVDELRKILESVIAPGGYSPFSNRPADHLGGLGADRR